MRIAVLDAATVNPGDLSWAPLEALGETTVYARTSPDEFLDRARSAEALIINKVPLTRERFEALPELRYVGVTATGYNVVDTQAARACGVTVTNVPTYGTAAVAQATFALLLELTNHAGALSGDVATRWPRSADFCYWDRPIVELTGLTLGVVGMGRIGQAVGRIGRAFGMNVLACDERDITDPDVRQVDLDEIFVACDVVSLHCPLTERTEGLVNADRLARMKPTAYLLNTSRGPLVDEHALAAALHESRLAGAGLDVLGTEPPHPDNPLFGAPRCVITPHVAWAAAASRRRLLEITVENLRAFLDGAPQHVVS